MKGKTHLAINTIILITIIIFFLIYETELKILFIFSRIFKEQTLTILTISSILFILGAIIPDIDSKNNKSYIFYKPIAKTIFPLNNRNITNFNNNNNHHINPLLSNHKKHFIIHFSILVIKLILRTTTTSNTRQNKKPFLEN